MRSHAVVAIGFALFTCSPVAAKSVVLNYQFELSQSMILASGAFYHFVTDAPVFELNPGDSFVANVRFKQSTLTILDNGTSEGFGVGFSAVPGTNGAVVDVDPVYFSFDKPEGLKGVNKFYNSAGGAGFSGGPGPIDLTDDELTFSGFTLTAEYRQGTANMFQLRSIFSIPTTLARVNLMGPKVPEPATWAMMVTGFGFMGGAVRRRKASKSSTRVQREVTRTPQGARV